MSRTIRKQRPIRRTPEPRPATRERKRQRERDRLDQEAIEAPWVQDVHHREIDSMEGEQIERMLGVVFGEVV